MNTKTAYATNVQIDSLQRGEYSVIDTASNRKIGHVSVIRGFMHYTGSHGTAHEGIGAVIRPRMEEGPNHKETITRELRDGIVDGRDDRF